MKVMSVFGTRPEAIKMAPLVKTLESAEGIESVVCVTAQHREMLDQVLRLFEIEPAHDLNIMKPGQSLSYITAEVLKGLEGVIIEEKPDLLLVHGDTTTTFAASLAAFYQKVPVGHVEAGLRTYNKYSPYPEEINRNLTGRIAELHFAPTENNKNNLLRENVPEENIFVTGNTVIDAIKMTAGKPFDFENETLKSLDFEGRRVITLTCHRRENLGEHMAQIFGAVADIVRDFPDAEVVYPVHLNPAVRRTAAEVLSGSSRVHLIEPLEYQEFVNLMAKSYLIITDSGGMQEEAPALGKPVLVVRRETERPEAVSAGVAKLAGTERSSVYAAAAELLSEPEKYDAMARAVNPYGDGHACERILAAIRKRFSV